MDKYVLPNDGSSLTVPLSGSIAPGDVTSAFFTLTRLAPTGLDPGAQASSAFQTTLDGFVAAGVTVQPDENSIRAIWNLRAVINTASGQIVQELQFMVEQDITLVKGVNSFQSWWELQLTLEEVPGIDFLKSLSESEMVAQLANAYRTIGTLAFVDITGEHWDITSYTAEELDDLTPDFLKALTIAQVIEANEYADPNSIHYKRLSGLMSETIGESSMMFKSGNTDNSPVTRRSMMFLRNYVLIRARLARG